MNFPDVSDYVVAEVLTSQWWMDWQYDCRFRYGLSDQQMSRLLGIALCITDGKQGEKLRRWLWFFQVFLDEYWIEFLFDIPSEMWHELGKIKTLIRGFNERFVEVYQELSIESRD